MFKTIAVCLVVLASSTAVHGQTAPAADRQTRSLNLSAYAELLRVICGRRRSPSSPR